jgi:hypothetical protein
MVPDASVPDVLELLLEITGVAVAVEVADVVNGVFALAPLPEAVFFFEAVSA